MCKTLNHSENDDQQFLMHLQRFGENTLNNRDFRQIYYLGRTSSITAHL